MRRIKKIARPNYQSSGRWLTLDATIQLREVSRSTISIFIFKKIKKASKHWPALADKAFLFHLSRLPSSFLFTLTLNVSVSFLG
jgi:hypothetical protein